MYMKRQLTAAAKIARGGDISRHRDSNLELFRIITMLVIVAHHYVVNSGVSGTISDQGILSFNRIFLLLFGWGGKTGINCFVLITGYFMCKSKTSARKFLKLILWMEFYKVIFYLIFTLTGYQAFSIKTIIYSLLPITSVSNDFGSAYLVFYLFIPFLNILVQAMDKKKHLTLVALCVSVYTIFATLRFSVAFNYVTWFCVIYLIGSYIRMYPERWFDNNKIWGAATVLSLLASWSSVIGMALLTLKLKGEIKQVYFFVADSNKAFALLTAVCAFMFFKNLKINYNKFINAFAASAFGVLLIHANSDAMRQWLWKDTLNNVGWMDTKWIVLHSFGSVMGIYIICAIIDMFRANFFEKPFFEWCDRHFSFK